MEEKKKKKQKLSLRKRLAFMAIVLLLCFFILEVMMIVLEPYLFTGFYQYDPDLGFMVRPGARGTNRFGFCDRDYPLERSPGTFRILVVGDSFGWSEGRNGNYTALLEKYCDARFGAGLIEVVNSGYPMTHTGEQLAMLKKYGLQYDPDFVLLGFFVGNDFIDADPFRKRIVVNDTYFDIDRRREIIILGYPVVLKSRLFHFLKQKIILLKELLKTRGEQDGNPETPVRTQKGSFFVFPRILPSLGLPGGDEGNDPGKSAGKEQGPFTEETILATERHRLQFCNLSLQKAGQYNQAINHIFESIDGMKELLDSRKIPFAVALFPDQFQVNEAMLEETLARYNLRKEDHDIELMQKILKEFLESRNIPYIDFLDDFRKKGKETLLYRPGDTHWNQAGNRLAAEILFKELPGILKASKF